MHDLVVIKKKKELRQGSTGALSSNTLNPMLMIFILTGVFSVFDFQEKESIAKCISDLKVLAKATQAKATA